MSGALSRRKGVAFERALVLRFREAMPDVEIKRGFQYRSGSEAPDVDVPCFFIEAKHHHRTSVRAALEQATEAAPEGRWPLAICKDDRKPPLVAM
ncbi:MAG: hypothetical protein MUC50_20360, partial [Myxococcota bacterium]|nr:hypothetical protein [Myxococcota bacterium]